MQIGGVRALSSVRMSECCTHREQRALHGDGVPCDGHRTWIGARRRGLACSGSLWVCAVLSLSVCVCVRVCVCMCVCVCHQVKLERLPEVARAFVHLDYECAHSPGIEHKEL